MHYSCSYYPYMLTWYRRVFVSLTLPYAFTPFYLWDNIGCECKAYQAFRHWEQGK